MAFQQQMIIDSLKANDQRVVAMALAALFAEKASNNVAAEHRQWFRNILPSLGEIVWSDRYAPKKEDTYEDAVKKKENAKIAIENILKDVPGNDAELKKTLVEAYVRLGHIYELAGHSARENFFRNRRDQEKTFCEKNPGAPVPQKNMVPGGVHEMLFHDDYFKTKTPENPKAVGEVVKALSEPVTEYVLTQHPTNTNQLKFMQLMRETSKSLDNTIKESKDGKGSSDAWNALDENITKLADFKNNPVVSSDNFTAFDETGIVINFLSNVPLHSARTL